MSQPNKIVEVKKYLHKAWHSHNITYSTLPVHRSLFLAEGAPHSSKDICPLELGGVVYYYSTQARYIQEEKHRFWTSWCCDIPLCLFAKSRKELIATMRGCIEIFHKENNDKDN